MTLRRLYLYLVSAVSLGLLAAGLALLGNTVLLFVFNDPSAQNSRTQLAAFTAMTAVALPVWAIHFWFARRYAMRDPYERASAIRRLYVYWACLGSTIGALVALAVSLGYLLRLFIDPCGPFAYAGQPCTLARAVGIEQLIAETPNPYWLPAAQAGWVAAVFLAIWAFHFWIAARDRAAAGETGASATLRRWYMYVALLVGLLVMLSGASSLIQAVWLNAVNSPLANNVDGGGAAGLFIAGLLVWGFHARTVAQHHVADDRNSTLRAVQGFIALAVSIAIAVFGASQILYYALARALGVDNPGGAGNDILGALASPASLLAVYGTAWFLMRRRLARDAETQEGDRQAGIRRLYTNLASLVSLGAWAIGAGGLLWTLAEQAEAPIIGVSASDWKNPTSLWLTLLVVGAAVWLAHWRQAPWAADRHALPRRLYIWAALLACVLAALGAGVGMLAAVLSQAFSARPTLADSANLNFGHYLAVLVVAAGVGLYHWRVLRADAATRPPRATAQTAPAVVAAAVPVLVPAPPDADPNTRRYLLSVTDATEDDVHQALSSLPPHAAYKLTPAERGALPVDGH
jgi:uncharacterized protein DUF5671